MQRDRGASRVEEVFRDVLEDDEPVEEGATGVGQTRRMGTDAGAAQAMQAGTPHAAGVAPEREGEAPPPPNRPSTLDPSRTDVDRNAAGGGWAGVAEVVESDYETEELRRREAEGQIGEPGEPGEPDPDEGQPHERMRM
jgi:hypothetical protein